MDLRTLVDNGRHALREQSQCDVVDMPLSTNTVMGIAGAASARIRAAATVTNKCFILTVKGIDSHTRESLASIFEVELATRQKKLLKSWRTVKGITRSSRLGAELHLHLFFLTAYLPLARVASV